MRVLGTWLVVALIAPGGVVPAGTRLQARMNQTIGTVESLGPDRVADRTRAGEPFTATVEAPIVDETGRVLLAPGALVRGRITVLERGEGAGTPHVELAVDSLDGRPFDGRVAEVEVQRLVHEEAGRDVDSAAYSGALLGGLLFGVPGVFVGMAFGSSNAGVQAVRERKVEGWISAGSLITVELAAPLPLSRY
jgi:hypothetical protein